MSQYVTTDYYLNVYGGTTITPSELNNYLQLAQEKIDEVTFNRIIGIGFDNLTDFQQENIRKSICRQAEYYFENGVSPLSIVSSYSVLDVSVNIDTTNETEAHKACMDEFAYMCIKKTGLTSRLL